MSFGFASCDHRYSGEVLLTMTWDILPNPAGGIMMTYAPLTFALCFEVEEQSCSDIIASIVDLASFWDPTETVLAELLSGSSAAPRAPTLTLEHHAPGKRATAA